MSEEKKVITCSECGNEHEEQVKFCSNCGAKMEEGPFAEAAEAAETEAVEPVVADDATVTEGENSVLESVLLQEEPVIIDSAPETEELPPERETILQPVTNPVYVEVPSQTVQTMAEPGTKAPTGNGSPGFAIASMILGILSLLCCCVSAFSLICAIVAIILGIVGIYNKYDGKGMAIAGIVMGSISLVVFVIIIVFVGSAGLLEALNSGSF